MISKIDSHLHVDFSGFDLDKLISYMNRNDIEKCWLLTWEEMNPVFPELYENLDVEKALETSKKHPGRIIPFYAPDPGREDFDEIMKEYINRGIKGCGELKASYLWKDKETGNLLQLLDKYNLPLVFHMEKEREIFRMNKNTRTAKFLNQFLNGALKGKTRKYSEKLIETTGFFRRRFHDHLEHFPGYLPDFDGLEERLQQFPGVRFVAHGPDVWKNIQKSPDPFISFAKGKIKEKGILVDLLMKYDNLYADISGKSGYFALKRDPAFTRWFLDTFYQKILFGTDNFEQLPFEQLLLETKIDQTKLNHIFRYNAEKLCE